MTYPVIEIADNAPELLEQQGTKSKYWVYHDSVFRLFKIGRANMGENWSEKVACELANLLNLPHAHYELAIWKQHKGVLSTNFIPDGGRLVTGNELLATIHALYPIESRYKVNDHTIRRIIAYLSNPIIQRPIGWIIPAAGIKNAVDIFLGYLLLDAWIANQDRHHENWGVINYDGQIYLAPTYDHAASLGQNELDTKRYEMLNTKDNGRHISHYVTKARSAIYESKTAKRAFSTVAVFQWLARQRPDAAQFWLKQLSSITIEQCQAIFEQIPDTEINKIAIEFALKLLNLNKERLLEIIS